jgi:hypothetical protein
MQNAASRPQNAKNFRYVKYRQARKFLLAAALALLPAGAAFAQDAYPQIDDFHFTGTLGADYSNGSYGTSRNTDVELGLGGLSMETGNFKFTASMPYMRISGRGLVIFDAVGNPIVINRRTALPPDVRSGFGDLNLSASYTIPGDVLDDFQVRLAASTKLPTASARKRLSTGEADYGMSIDVSRKFGIWGPFVTVGYLFTGEPVTYKLYDTVSVSAGTSAELSNSLVAVASYDYVSASTPLVQESHQLFGSLSWIRDDAITLTGYATTGLNPGSPSVGGGLLMSYGFN